MAASRALKLGGSLKELRIHLCQVSGESQGVRQFIENQYVSLKKNNPQFPILIRECSGVQPKLYARYEYGKEDSISLANMKSEQVMQALERLATKK